MAFIQWNYSLYFALIIVILPVYFVVFICLLKLRTISQSFRTTFYTILVQHSIADILSLSLYSVEKLLTLIIPDVLYNFHYVPIPPIIYYTVVWGITFKSHGTAFLTIHRYLIIVKPFHLITQHIQNAKLPEVISIYWIPPLIFNLIIFSDLRIKFESPQNLQTMGETTEITDKVTKWSIIVLFFSSAVCIICYLLINKFVRGNSKSISKSMRRELRLAVQILLILIAQIVLFLYMAFINVFVHVGSPELVSQVKRFTPLANGLPSFLTPFTILFFNKELSKKIRKILRGKGADSHSELSNGVSMILPWTTKKKIRTSIPTFKTTEKGVWQCE